MTQLQINPSECRGNYSAISNNMKLVHWPLMGGGMPTGIRKWIQISGLTRKWNNAKMYWTCPIADVNQHKDTSW